MWIFQKCKYKGSKYTIESNNKEKSNLSENESNHFPQGRTKANEASSVTTSSKEIAFAAATTVDVKLKVH